MLTIFQTFHCLNQENIFNNTIAKDPTSGVSVHYLENKTTSVKHFNSASSGSKADTLYI